MIAANPDELVMLLSTDWFFPHWESLGLYLSENQSRRVQLGCRDLVRQIVAGADQYWLSEFSEERIARTRNNFVCLLHATDVPKSTIATVEMLYASDFEARQTSGSSWLGTMITRQLVNSTLTTELCPEPDVRQAIENAWNAAIDFMDRTSNLDEECMNSTSTWDQFTRSLTPDRPTALSDYLVSIDWDERFGRFWDVLRSRADDDTMARIRRWYKRAAKSMADAELVLPDERSS